jgi:SAM-dependent methyltransferase
VAGAGDYEDPVRARAYDKRAGTTRAEARALWRLLRGRAVSGTILDAPCGNGRLSAFWAEVGRRTVGLDGALAMARLAASRGVGAVQGVAEALPFADRCADLVAGIRLLHHYRDRTARVAVLREYGRVARGTVLVSFYRRISLEGLRRWLRPKRRSTRVGLTVREFRRDAAEAGLRMVGWRSLLPLVREQTFALLEPRRPCPEGRAGL